ncbi:hypothetical protein, partial [Sphingomonas sanguinis]|uniref:hypothetical protein n=1 Tax=Sphingomonas sanguinis TaxID=33051 RepID=UPI003016F38F
LSVYNWMGMHGRPERRLALFFGYPLAILNVRNWAGDAGQLRSTKDPEAVVRTCLLASRKLPLVHISGLAA